MWDTLGGFSESVTKTAQAEWTSVSPWPYPALSCCATARGSPSDRDLHSSTSQLNLSRLCHRNPETTQRIPQKCLR